MAYNKFMQWLDLIYPKRCVGCKRLGRYICGACQKQITTLSQLCPECNKWAIDGMTHARCLRPLSLEGLVSLFRYDKVVKQAIKSLKYRLVYDIVETLVDLISFDKLKPVLIRRADTVLYPLPLHQERFQRRGFNQAEMLGRSVATWLNIKIVHGLLVRVKKRKPQAEIQKRTDRIKNAQGLFVRSPNVLVSRYPNIILFDDVWTTGATMKEACKVLKRNGIKFVFGLTIAR